MNEHCKFSRKYDLKLRVVFRYLPALHHSSWFLVRAENTCKQLGLKEAQSTGLGSTGMGVNPVTVVEIEIPREVSYV